MDTIVIKISPSGIKKKKGRKKAVFLFSVGVAKSYAKKVEEKKTFFFSNLGN